MIPYLLIFSVTILLTYYAERLIKSNNKKQAFLIMGICVFTLSFFAGIRSDNIGKDIETYVIPSFRWAQHFKFWDFMAVGNLEKGYMVFTFIIVRIFNDYHLVLFAMQAIVSTIIYIFAYKNKDNISMTLVIFAYLMIFFNDTFTMMRQSVACALILMSTIKLKEKRYISTAILYLLAISFHTTACISILLYVVMFLDSTSKLSENRKKWINIILFAGIFIGTIAYEKILYVITYNIPILQPKFYEYINSIYYNQDGLSISKSILIFKTLWICVVAYMSIIMKKQKFKTSLKFLCIDMCIYIASFKLPPIMRLGEYFTYPALLNIVPKIGEIFENDKNKRICLNILCIAFLMFFWYFTNVVHYENGGTYPYKSDILINMN